MSAWRRLWAAWEDVDEASQTTRTVVALLVLGALLVSAMRVTP